MKKLLQKPLNASRILAFMLFSRVIIAPLDLNGDKFAITGTTAFIAGSFMGAMTANACTGATGIDLEEGAATRAGDLRLGRRGRQWTRAFRADKFVECHFTGCL